MEKRIIINEQQNVFALNGTNLEPLGKACELNDVWQQKVFAIGKNLYFKKENDIFLLAENIDSIYEIKIDDFAWKQFELVGDVLVMVDTDMDGIKKLDKAYAPYLDWTIARKEKPILFLKQENEKSLLVVIEDENGDVRLSEQKAYYLDKNSSLLYWNYRIYSYSFKRKEFFLSSLHLLFAGDNYLIFISDDTTSAAIAIDKKGNMTPLGEEAQIVERPNATLLKSTKGVYHLKKDALRSVIDTNLSDGSSYINDFGTIYHYYTKPIGAGIRCTDEYRLVDGEYRIVKR